MGHHQLSDSHTLMNYSLGIDLHKRSSVWVLLNNEKKVVSEQTLSAERDDIPYAIRQLGVPPEQVTAVVEPVCGWRWYAEALEQCGVHVKIANPSQIRLIADSRTKTDHNDARTLADLLRADFLPESYRAPKEVASFRALVRERQYLISIQTGLKNRIHAVVLREGHLNATLHPLRVRTTEALSAVQDAELTRLFDLLYDFERRIKPLEKELTRMVRTHPLGNLIRSMPGVGYITAGAILAEVGDFTRFRTAGQLCAYAGLVPSERSSGAYRRLGHITKRGSKVLRYSIVEASFRVRSNHPLYTFYARLVPKTGKKKARVALARKMLSILWHMVRTNTHFDPTQYMTKRDDLATAFLTR